ncbi:MAG: hypothetical protein F6J86_20945 [Symploca sp. SIO1B1]|nr:hypothetical protein [Symploca sp. SIO1C2]NER96278.1 hypothetical protein [Symploca sp. SIO1B1]
MKTIKNSAQNTDNRKLFQPKSKPQISSVPGVGAKEKYRYRVVLAGRILGACLTLEQALAITGLGGVL